VREDPFPDLDAVSLLAEPVRRRLYLCLTDRGRAAGRDELAAAAGVGRSLAAYHLDRLAEHGLLEVEYARPAGRSGPGAGRPAKLYRTAQREFAVRVPPRDYRLLAELLVHGEGANDAARELGHAHGELVRGTPLADVLRARGYEPFEVEAGSLRLRNCPFEAVAADCPAVVCGLNLALLEGLLDGLGDESARAVLAPAPGACCVRIDTTPA
jgi:predicted ArsR family transcriptional regulator